MSSTTLKFAFTTFLFSKYSHKKNNMYNEIKTTKTTFKSEVCNLKTVKIKSGYIRHRWPMKADFSIYRPIGIPEYLFLHFYTPFEIKLGDKTITTKPHACIIIEKHTPQIYRCSEKSVHDWFRLEGDVEALLATYGLRTNTIYYPKNYSFITSLTRRMELESREKKEYYEELCGSHLNNLFIQLSREISNKASSESLNPETVDQLKKLRFTLACNYSKKWTIDSMAKEISLSSSYLHAAYKKYYGISPMQDLITIRIYEATSMLSSDTKSIREIADELGYPSTSQFIRQFTKSIGVSPLKYRRLLTQSN